MRKKLKDSAVLIKLSKNEHLDLKNLAKIFSGGNMSRFVRMLIREMKNQN